MNNTAITQQEMPEMMTKMEYLEAQTELDRVSGIEGAGSLYRLGRLEADHIRYVRAAVHAHRNVHFENMYEYRNIIPGLKQYSLNRDIAVYDKSKVSGKLKSGDIAFNCYLEGKRC